tara:strand:- start:1575 stop:5471 length:3897 start_codon:yes stop_codon:yes gene_type:complete
VTELNVPPFKDYKTNPLPPADLKVSTGSTLGSQYGNIFNPIGEGLSFYGGSQSPYDSQSIQIVEDLIKESNLSKDDAIYLRTYGIGSKDNLQAALSYVRKRSETREVLAQSSGASLFLTDPSLLASVFIPYFGVAALGRTRSLLNNLTSSSALSQAVRAKEILRIGPTRVRVGQLGQFDDAITGVSNSYDAKGLAKLGALDAAVVDGSVSTIQAMTEISEGKDPIQQIANAALFTTASTAVGGMMGYGFGSLLVRPKNGKVRTQAFNDGYRRYLNSISEEPPSLNIRLNTLDKKWEANNAKLKASKAEGLRIQNQVQDAYDADPNLTKDSSVIKDLIAKNKSNESKIDQFQTIQDGLGKERAKILEEQNGEDGISLAGGWFNNSWFMRAVPTVIRTTIRDKYLPKFAKMDMLLLGGDNGMPLAMNQMGESVGSSTFIKTARRQGDWFKALDVINTNYREISPRGAAQIFNVPVGEYVERVRRKLGKDSFAPDEWYNHIGVLMIDEVPFDKMTPQEAASVQAARTFFDKYGVELEQVGLINSRDLFDTTFNKANANVSRLESLTENIIEQNQKWMSPQLLSAAAKIQATNQKLRSLGKIASTRGLTDKQVKFQASLEKQLVGLQEVAERFDNYFSKIDDAKNVDDLAALFNDLDLTDGMRLALGKAGDDLALARARVINAKEMIDRAPPTASQNSYLTRIFNRRKIVGEREAFRKILIDWFRANPEQISRGDDGLFKIDTLPVDDASLIARADRTIDNILGETDEDAVDAIFTGIGKSGPLVSRRLNIPNKLIKDFIVTDIKEVMIAYTNRVAPKIEYHKQFRNPKNGRLMSLEDRTDYYRQRLTEEGVNEKTIDEYIKNFVATYDQVVGTTLKRPDAIDTKVAEFLRTATSWTFLGGSGTAALGDAASIFMDHELNVIGKSFLGMMDDLSLNMSTRELQLAGEALEIVRGTTHLKYLESLTNDAYSKTLPDKLNNAFYIMNGLAPVTVAIKSMDGLLRGHTIIEASTRLVNGTASKFEREFLARYNINEELARRISKSPYKKSQGELFLPNTEAWTDDVAVNAFREALASGVINRVIMGTPADKPLMMSGVAYVPDSIAKFLPFDLPVDPRVQGYRRVESGLLALPFTFYSYTMGALSKITGNYASGSVRNKAAHTAVALGLGYAIVRSRTPSWAWDDMDTEDKIMRSFDFSGLAAIYSDMTYRAIAMANEMGVESGFPIQPKFDAGTDPLGAAVSLGGAPADWSYEVLSAIKQMLDGDIQDGAKSLIRMMPLIDTLATGDVIKDAATGLVGNLPNRQ